jgi:glucokinase
MSKKVKYAIGVDLGATAIKIGMVSQSGEILKQVTVNTNAEEGPKKVINNIKMGIHTLLTGTKFNVKGIGIGCPGIVDPDKGTVENPPNIPGWEKINLGKIIREEFNQNVYLDNDANAAAIGELVFGSGRQLNSFIMVTLGTGVGGGIVIDRKVYHGEYGAAGEIGHITIDYKGAKCYCGSIGCIEAYAGNRYLIERVKNELVNHPDSLLIKLSGNDINSITPKIIKAAADKGDEFCKSIIVDLGTKLGAAFASISNILDISTFIIGGGVAGFGKPLFNSVKKSLKERVMTPLKPRIKILPAQLKNDAGIKGASALVFHGE